jgi:Zn-dependent metalloprotease
LFSTKKIIMPLIRKTITTVFLLAVLSASQIYAQVLSGADAFGQVKGARQVILNPTDSKPSFVEFESGKGPYVSEFGAWLKQNFGYSTQFGLNLISSESDKLGFEHIRYSQTFMTYPINHSMLILHVKGSRVVSFNGDLSPVGISVAKPGIDQNAALQAAMKHVGAKSYKWEIPAEEAFLKREQNNEKATFFPKGELMWVSESFKGGQLLPTAWMFMHTCPCQDSMCLSMQTMEMSSEQRTASTMPMKPELLLLHSVEPEVLWLIIMPELIA